MNPPIAYTLLGAFAAALGTAALFIALLKRMAGKREGGREAHEILSSEIDALRQGYEALRVELRSLEMAIASTPSEYMVRPSLNLAKRSRILRQHRRGESVESISAALQVPRAEVDLLLKIHQIGLRKTNIAAS